jgi:hypothetical protein
MDNDSNSDYSSIYYSGPSVSDSEKEVIVAERGKVIFGLYTEFHYETMYYPLIFPFLSCLTLITMWKHGSIIMSFMATMWLCPIEDGIFSINKLPG